MNAMIKSISSVVASVVFLSSLAACEPGRIPWSVRHPEEASQQQEASVEPTSTPSDSDPEIETEPAHVTGTMVFNSKKNLCVCYQSASYDLARIRRANLAVNFDNDAIVPTERCPAEPVSRVQAICKNSEGYIIFYKGGLSKQHVIEIVGSFETANESEADASCDVLP